MGPEGNVGRNRETNLNGGAGGNVYSFDVAKEMRELNPEANLSGLRPLSDEVIEAFSDGVNEQKAEVIVNSIVLDTINPIAIKSRLEGALKRFEHKFRSETRIQNIKQYAIEFINKASDHDIAEDQYLHLASLVCVEDNKDVILEKVNRELDKRKKQEMPVVENSEINKKKERLIFSGIKKLAEGGEFKEIDNILLHGQPSDIFSHLTNHYKDLIKQKTELYQREKIIKFINEAMDEEIKKDPIKYFIFLRALEYEGNLNIQEDYSH